MGSTLTSSVDSTVVKNWREHHPSSFSLKIHNFSQLENSTTFSDHRYQSGLFKSGDCNWRLIVYPKGNIKDNESVYISMYVEIDSTSFTSTPLREVFAELRFFVYNQKQNKYFTIQDVEVKRFNALKTVWGLVQVLPCDTFNNPENGYIFEGGQCEFGVDVIVASPLTNWEILSFNEKLSHPNKFSWTLKNFSKLKEDVQRSHKFAMGGTNWVLELYPKGDSRAEGKWLSLYLKLPDSETLRQDEKIFNNAHVRVLHPSGSNHLSYQLNKWHSKLFPCWGWYKFLSLAKLREDYLDKEDSLRVEVEFEVVSATKYSSMQRFETKLVPIVKPAKPVTQQKTQSGFFFKIVALMKNHC